MSHDIARFAISNVSALGASAIVANTARIVAPRYTNPIAKGAVFLGAVGLGSAAAAAVQKQVERDYDEIVDFVRSFKLQKKA